MLLGEKMPDKDDPKYKERYERDVKAGRKFAHALGIDRAAACVQRFADRHRTLFLVIVFAFVAFSLGLNIYRIATACQRPSVRQTATAVQDGGQPVFGLPEIDSVGYLQCPSLFMGSFIG